MCKFIGKSKERILCKPSNSEILRLYSIVHVVMETTKTSNFTCQSKSFINREYFMESAGVRYLHTSCFCISTGIRNRTSERSERVRFLIQKQRVGKYRTKHFTCSIVFIVYILRHSSFWWPFNFKSFQNA